LILFGFSLGKEKHKRLLVFWRKWPLSTDGGGAPVRCRSMVVGVLPMWRGMWYVPMWRGMWFCASEAGCNRCAFWLVFGGLVMIISNKGVDSRIIMV